MNRQWKQLDTSRIDAIAHTGLQAYPGMGQTQEHREQVATWARHSIEDWPWQALYGIEEDGELLGSLCVFYMDVNVRGIIVPFGGIGSVQTAPLHRQKGVAQEMVRRSLLHFREKGIGLVGLYPFRASFYRRMGFGYGAEMRRYRLSPTSFPRFTGTGTVCELRGTDADRARVLACYDAFSARTHGMSMRLDRSMGDVFEEQHAVYGYKENGELTGYMVTRCTPSHALKSDLHIAELVYNSPEALHAMLGFLRKQSDQFERVTLETQDDALRFLLEDQASGTYDAFASQYVETSTVGLGLMYRVVDVAMVIEQMHDVPWYALT